MISAVIVSIICRLEVFIEMHVLMFYFTLGLPSNFNLA